MNYKLWCFMDDPAENRKADDCGNMWRTPCAISFDYSAIRELRTSWFDKLTKALNTFNIYVFSAKFLQKHTLTNVTISQRKFNDLGMIILIKKIIYTIEICWLKWIIFTCIYYITLSKHSITSKRNISAKVVWRYSRYYGQSSTFQTWR